MDGKCKMMMNHKQNVYGGTENISKHLNRNYVLSSPKFKLTSCQQTPRKSFLFRPANHLLPLSQLWRPDADSAFPVNVNKNAFQYRFAIT